jgi:hypothetical protein
MGGSIYSLNWVGLNNGQNCVVGGQCKSGYCAAGVCCATPCDGELIEGGEIVFPNTGRKTVTYFCFPADLQNTPKVISIDSETGHQVSFTDLDLEDTETFKIGSS